MQEYCFSKGSKRIFCNTYRLQRGRNSTVLVVMPLTFVINAITLQINTGSRLVTVADSTTIISTLILAGV